MKPEPHDCKFCEKQLYRRYLGQHYVKCHMEELIKDLVRYKNTKAPHFPLSLSVNNKFICLCCYDVQTQKARAEKHAEQNPACSFENQLRALWVLLDMEPPQNAKLVVTTSYSREKTLLTEAKKSEDEYYKLYIKSKENGEKLQAQNVALKLQLDKLRENSTNATESKNKLVQTASFIIIQNLSEKLEALRLRMNREAGPILNSIVIDDEDNNKLAGLLMDYKQYNPSYTLPAHLDHTKFNTEIEFESLPVTENIMVVEPVIEFDDGPLFNLVPKPEPLKPVRKSITQKEDGKCYDCKTSCEYTTLVSCSICHIKKCDFNQIQNCFLYDCASCNKKSYCRGCYIKSGGTKQYCSLKCLKMGF